MTAKKVELEYLIETDVLLGFLTGSYASGLFEGLLLSGICYTSVLNAAEVMQQAFTDLERKSAKQLLSVIKVLGIPGRYALEVGRAGKQLSLREELMVVLAKMNSLTIVTQYPSRYEGTDTAFKKFN